MLTTDKEGVWQEKFLLQEVAVYLEMETQNAVMDVTMESITVKEGN